MDLITKVINSVVNEVFYRFYLDIIISNYIKIILDNYDNQSNAIINYSSENPFLLMDRGTDLSIVIYPYLNMII